MRIGTSFRRLLSERRLFVPWVTAASATLSTGIIIWQLDPCREAPFLIFVFLVSLGGGWLFAFYMWHLNDAAKRNTELWVSTADQEKKRDV